MNAADLLLEACDDPDNSTLPAILTRDQSITYQELGKTVNQYAHALIRLDVQPQDRVLMLVDDSADFFFTYLGIMKVGAVPVALNLRISPPDLAFIIDDSGCKLFIADEFFMPIYEQAIDGLNDTPKSLLTTGTMPGYQALDELAHDKPGSYDSEQLDPGDMAFWMYTSGTTGKPKAVVHIINSITHIDSYLGAVYGVKPGERIFCSSKLFFAFSLGHCFLASLRLGATTILHSGWPKAEAIAAVVDQFQPTVLLSVPTMYKNLLAEGLADSKAFGGVRHFISAGEHLPRPLCAEWMKVTGRPILEGIGATEALLLFLSNRPESFTPGATGIPLPSIKVKLVSETGEDITETGIPGVMHVKTKTRAKGYWNQAEKSSAAFYDDWYITGDVFVRHESGTYYHQGRDDDMLKISGQWVSPSEIEEFVLKNPEVQSAAVVGVNNEKGLPRLALCLVAADLSVDTEKLEKEITETLTKNLSVYKCPRRFFHLTEMPMTGTGKIQRFKLRQMITDQFVTPS